MILLWFPQDIIDFRFPVSSETKSCFFFNSRVCVTGCPLGSNRRPGETRMAGHFAISGDVSWHGWVRLIDKCSTPHFKLPLFKHTHAHTTERGFADKCISLKHRKKPYILELSNSYSYSRVNAPIPNNLKITSENWYLCFHFLFCPIKYKGR